MRWSELFNVLVVSHLVGDFVLQTQWQATMKPDGLGPDRERRRALASHLMTYTFAFLPALVWVATQEGVAGVVVVVVTAIMTHGIQDDGRLLRRYVIAVKKVEPACGSPLWIAIDQSFHIVTLLGTALLVGLAL